MSFDYSPENLDREFPVRRNLIYMNHAAVAPLPRRVAEAIVAHIENVRDRGAADWRRWYAEIDRTREKAAAFLGARTSEVAFVPSTSWGLSLVARSFPWREGDNIVGDDMEFPANVYPWMMLADQRVEYRLAKSRAGQVGVDDIAEKVDARTRVVAVSWVAFHNGFV
jgi:selenocysteine lyase/cysteine desulfurase